MKRWGIALGAAVVVAAAVFAVVELRPDPTGRATGAMGASAEGRDVWAALAKFEDPYLGAWSERFAEGPADNAEVLAVFQELASNVTGYGGLWRKTVPNEYFGCAADADPPICRTLASAEKNFARWDALQETMSGIEDERAARAFLRRNRAAMLDYLQTYVPSDRSLSAVQATPFFAENLAAALQ